MLLIGATFKLRHWKSGVVSVKIASGRGLPDGGCALLLSGARPRERGCLR